MLDPVQVRITLGLHALRSAAFQRALVLSCQQAELGKLWATSAQSALNDAIGCLRLFAARNTAAMMRRR